MHAGKKIKLLRNIKEITQQELADQINKTRTLVSHIEQTGKVNYYTLKSFLRVFNLTHEEFEEFGEGLTNTLKSSKPTTARFSVSSLQEKLDSCQKENELLKRIIESQNKTIAILEKKKTR